MFPLESQHNYYINFRTCARGLLAPLKTSIAEPIDSQCLTDVNMTSRSFCNFNPNGCQGESPAICDLPPPLVSVHHGWLVLYEAPSADRRGGDYFAKTHGIPTDLQSPLRPQPWGGVCGGLCDAAARTAPAALEHPDG